MAQDYDKIPKENIEALIIPLADKLLGLKLGELEEMIAALLQSGLLTDKQITQVANASLARVRKIKAQITKK